MTDTIKSNTLIQVNKWAYCGIVQRLGLIQNLISLQTRFYPELISWSCFSHCKICDIFPLKRSQCTSHFCVKKPFNHLCSKPSLACQARYRGGDRAFVTAVCSARSPDAVKPARRSQPDICFCSSPDNTSDEAFLCCSESWECGCFEEHIFGKL